MANINKPKLSEYFSHKTKRNSLLKFISLLAIITGYFIFVSIRFGTKNGFFVTILTWSFFVFCTPIADAGFLVAFPIRMVSGIRMMYTQLASFVVAFLLNLYAFFYAPSVYSKTIILRLFYKILSHPFPFWAIIIVSFVGTIFSIYFGDEMIDVSSHKEREKYHKHANKYKLAVLIFLIVAIIPLYKVLLKKLGINIPL